MKPIAKEKKNDRIIIIRGIKTSVKELTKLVCVHTHIHTQKSSDGLTKT